MPHRIHDTRTIVIDDPVTGDSVNHSISLFFCHTRATVLAHSPGGSTSMQPLLYLLVSISQQRGVREKGGVTVTVIDSDDAALKLSESL